MPSVEPIFEDLRGRVLSLDPEAVGLTESIGGRGVWGSLMEIGTPDGVATFVMLADGTTSLYTSSGGGVIGGGEHDSVSRATKAYLEELERHLDSFVPEDADDLPVPGEVHFRALTRPGRLVARAPEHELREQRHPLSPLFYSGHDVITEVRLIEERKTPRAVYRPPGAGEPA